MPSAKIEVGDVVLLRHTLDRDDGLGVMPAGTRMTLVQAFPHAGAVYNTLEEEAPTGAHVTLTTGELKKETRLCPKPQPPSPSSG